MFVYIWLIIGLSIFTNLLARTEPLWQSKEYIKKAFFEIAYKIEFQEGDTRLKRWDKDINYKIEYFNLTGPVQIAEELIDIYLQDLSTITKVKINKNKHIKHNFKIILTTSKSYKDAINKYTSNKIENLDTTSNCVLYFRYNVYYALNSATVIIPVDYAMKFGLLTSCVIEELTQAMGLTNDSDWVNPSIANDNSQEDLLTGLDYIFLRILYDKRLSTGMTKNESSLVVDKILLDLDNNNIIKNSIQKAKQLNIIKLVE